MIEAICKHNKLPEPVSECRFAPPRRWRLDYAWPKHKLALEIEGGIWVRGRHNRPIGFKKDLEKYNTLTLMGWHLLRVTPDDIRNGTAARLLIGYFNGLGIQ